MRYVSPPLIVFLYGVCVRACVCVLFFVTLQGGLDQAAGAGPGHGGIETQDPEGGEHQEAPRLQTRGIERESSPLSIPIDETTTTVIDTISILDIR